MELAEICLTQKGTLGSLVLQQLLENHFSVTVLTRNRERLGEVPSGVEISEVDYSSVESLTAALNGHDAVVCTVSMAGMGEQKVMIDASIRAGVKRFIPADYGSLSTDPNAHWLPIHVPLVGIQQYLREKGQSGELEYSILATGPWIEFFINTPAIIDMSGRTAHLVDGGVHPFSTSSIASVSRAIVGVLKNPEDTKNRVVHVSDIVTTQARIVELGKKYTPGQKWTEVMVDSDAELQKGRDKMARGEPFDMLDQFGLLAAAMFSGNFYSKYDPVDNGLLGMDLMTEDKLEAIVAAAVGKIA